MNQLVFYISGDPDENLAISYIGLRGENTKVNIINLILMLRLTFFIKKIKQKNQIVKAVYESKPLIADHKVEGEIKNYNPIG